MNIYLTDEEKKEILIIPVMPPNIRINSPQYNENFKTINYGEIKLIGTEGLKGLNLSSFFPNRKYGFSHVEFFKPTYYIEKIEEWKKRRIPIRVVVTKASFDFNKRMTIEAFEYGVQDGTGDVYYDLKLEEFKDIVLKQRKV